MDDFNSFERTVEAMPQADCVLLTGYRPDDGIVCGEPYDSRTGQSWSLTMISSIEEAVQCRYQLAVPDEEVELNAYLEAHKAERPTELLAKD